MERTKGFTLIELIVSIGLFMIVVTIAMSAYLSLISLDRKARATNELVSNLSFVVDNMARSIRTGTGYDCGGAGGATNCPSGSSTFKFTNEDNQAVTYLLKSDYTVGSCVGTSGCTSSSATTLTDAQIKITRLTFYTQGVGTGDGVQPRVLFTLTGSITPDSKSDPVTFTIEGAATERLIEI